jgi:DNA modification methylase
LIVFAGSGSTLIAADQTNRIGYGIELDRGYVDVIIERLGNFTGEKAVLVSNAESTKA